MEKVQTPLRTAIMRIMSDMLDNADEHGLYDTGRFMDKIEQLLCDMMAAPEVMELSGSEAVFGIMAWLSTRNATTVIGPHQVVDIDIIKQFIETNHLKEPREMWDTLLTHPPEPAPESVEAVAADPPPLPAEELDYDFEKMGIDFISASFDNTFPEGLIEMFTISVEPVEGEILDASLNCKSDIGDVRVEGSIEEVVQFIIANGLHIKPKPK